MHQLPVVNNNNNNNNSLYLFKTLTFFLFYANTGRNLMKQKKGTI